MQHKFENVFEIFESYRFCEDLKLEQNSMQSISYATNKFYKNDFEVNENSSTSLHNILLHLLGKLNVPESLVKFFVYACPEIQAECYLGSENTCIIRVTSGMIKLLDADELKFVLGHELGHFILGHSSHDAMDNYWRSQAQEISADRIGIISAGSLEVASRAILKTVSGLGEDHLSFDISVYLAQMKKFLEVAGVDQSSTHPPMVLRMRALIWFSVSSEFLEYPKSPTFSQINGIDKKILGDFEKEKVAYQVAASDALKLEYTFWKIADQIAQVGSFTKSSQLQIQEYFSEDILEKLKSLFFNFGKDEVLEKVRNGMLEAEKNLIDLPIGDLMLNDLDKLIERNFPKVPQ